MTNKERLQQNNLELAECIDLVGTGNGGSGGSGVIDVTELPTENIDQSKIYRVKEESEPSVYLIWANYDFVIKKITFDEFVSQVSEGQSTCSSKYYEVDSLPEKPEMSVFDEDSFTMTQTVYILSSTGASYISLDGVEYVPLYDQTGDSELYNDYGWITMAEFQAIEATRDSYRTVAGLYSIRGETSTTYGIPDEADNKTVYEHTSATGWKELGAGGGEADGKPITVTTSAEMEEILASATDDTVGTFYYYTGETTDTYTNNTLYAVGKKEG